MDTKADKAKLVEIKAARPAILEVIEGLKHDLEQKDLLNDTVNDVQALLNAYEEIAQTADLLESHVNQSINTTEKLLSLGYPALPERDISPASFRDLDQNRKTIEVAQSKFHKRELTTAGDFVPRKETGIS